MQVGKIALSDLQPEMDMIGKQTDIQLPTTSDNLDRW